MAIVFLFLTLLVFVMRLLAELVRKLLPYLGMEGELSEQKTSVYPKTEAGQTPRDKGTPDIAAVLGGLEHYFPGTFHGRMDQEKMSEVAAAVAAVYQLGH